MNEVILDHQYTNQVYTAGKLKFTIQYIPRPAKHVLYVEAIDGSMLKRRFEFDGFYNGYVAATKKAQEIALKEGGR